MLQTTVQASDVALKNPYLAAGMEVFVDKTRTCIKT